MNIFGLGPMEILLILVIALIVFGPARLPEIMGKVGRAIAEFRRATSQLSDEFNRTIQAELQETRAMVEDTRSTVTGVQTSLNAALSGTPAPTRTAAPSAPPSPPNGNGTSPATGANGSVASAPPLADTAQWSWETSAPAPSQPAVEVGAAASQPAVEVASASSVPAAQVRKPKLSDDLLPPY
jgi:sec-independent protein translocase protein TatB